ncbi:MAG TPA: biopolymer transporter ExbD [Burkholderiales bacterium]
MAAVSNAFVPMPRTRPSVRTMRRAPMLHSVLTWYREAMTPDVLRARLAQAATEDPQPEIHLHADANTRYQELAELMSAVQNAGLKRMGFVTDPGK